MEDMFDFAWFQRVFGTVTPPGMVLVPGDEFEMGDPFNEGNPDERPVHTVYLSSYHIDKYEVTNQQYADALNWAYAQGGLIEVTGGGLGDCSRLSALLPRSCLSPCREVMK